MAIGQDIVRRVVVAFDADPSKLKKALDTIQIETRDATSEFNGFASAAHQALDTIGLGATAQVGPLGKLHNAFQGVTGKIGSGIHAIDGFAKALGPWNQALELGGKAVDFMSDSLDAYAQTSPEAERQVRKLKGEFADLAKSTKEAAGEITFLTLQALPSIKELEATAKRMAENGEDFAAAFKKATASLDKNAFDNLKDAFGDVKDLALETFHPNTWDPNVAKDALDSIGERMKKLRDNAKEAAREAAAFREEIAKLAAKEAKEATDDLVKRLTLETQQTHYSDTPGVDFAGAIGRLPSESEFEAFRTNLKELASDIGGENRQQTFLESMFGSIEEIDLYKQSWESLGSVFGAFTDALSAGYTALVTGTEPFGQAMKKMAASSILAAGAASVVDAARETALGFGALAFGPIGGVTAAAHFKSAALHAAVAAGAGLAARGLSGGASGGSSGGAASAPPSSAPTRGGGGGSGGGGGGEQRPIILVVGEHFGQMSARQRRIEAEEAVQRAIKERDE